MPYHRTNVGFFPTFWIVVFISTFLTQTGWASEAATIAEPRDAARWVSRYCSDCHGADAPEADLSLVNFTDHSPTQTRELWRQVWRQIEAGTMPPEDAEQPDDSQRNAILSWIVQQHGPVSQFANDDLWSLQTPVQIEPSDIAADESPIDWFIDRRLRQEGLSRSTRGDRRMVLRRVTLDFTGLPPTPAETSAFVNDEDDFAIAYGRVVDRLLDSPHYGERNAQHWLDLIRWAETVGFETNGERRDAWHYRDWLIRAFNQDMPYDEFIGHQLVGDATGADAALGFLVAGPANLPGQIGRDEEAMRQARQDELDEVVRTVSEGLLGLTVGCARCHDHKFDPISQRDYYSMQAIFAGLQYGSRRLRGPTDDEWTGQASEVRKQLDHLRLELETLRVQWGLREPLRDVHTDSFTTTRVDAVRMEIEATTSGPASLYEFQVWSLQTDDSDASNVALASTGSVVSASSFALANQTRHFDNLIDGSVDRRQAFPWVAATSGPAWLQVDLPKPTEIDRVTWHRGSGAPADYVIQVRDAETAQWRVVAHTRDRLPRPEDTRPAKAVQLSSLQIAAPEQGGEALEPGRVERIVKLIASIRSKENEWRRLSAGPQTYAARFSESPEKLCLLSRGDPMQPRAEAIASAPSVLVSTIPSTNPDSELRRRQDLVDHLTLPSHPLTSRVIVNRVWQHHFGIGLVETASDFGHMGQRPTHPELLDWLAVEFVKQGWSMKRLHRLIVMAETYTQSSYPRDDAIQVDAESRLLWRYPPRRLDAESIRDSILQTSGKLNVTMYGRGFDFFNQRGGLSDYRSKETFESEGWRRMIYAHKIRMQSVDVFGAFDCPDAGQMTSRRNQSITPIQALGLLNSPFIERQSAFFAERLRQEVGDDLNACVQRAFEIAFTRQSNESEQAALQTLTRDHGLEHACRILFNTSEFVSLQ